VASAGAAEQRLVTWRSVCVCGCVCRSFRCHIPHYTVTDTVTDSPLPRARSDTGHVVFRP